MNLLGKAYKPFGKKKKEIPAVDGFAIQYDNYSKKNNSVCVFASYSFGNKIADYVFYYLSELAKANCDILFVSASAIADDDIQELKKYSKLIIETNNVGLDFGSWQVGLSRISNGVEYEHVILANDSVIGPFFDLSGIIREMNSRKLDMWGMTESHQYARHLQSYFLSFNKKILNSVVWKNFWDDMEKLGDKNKIIQNYEIGLSQLMISHNFKIGAWTNIEDLASKHNIRIDEINPSLVFWDTIIAQKKYPFIKRELLLKIYLKRFFKVDKWKEVITQYTGYNTRYISEYLAYMEGFFNHEQRIPVKKVDPTNIKIAVHLHLYYTDLTDEFIKFLSRIKYKYDLYITLIKEDQTVFYNIQKRIPGVKFLICENRGKDIGGFLHFINHVDIEQYDLILKVHSKKSLNGHLYINEIKRFDRSIENGEDWRNLLLNALIPAHGVDKIVNHFVENPKTGMVGPKNFLTYSTDGNEPYLNKLCSRMGLDPYYDKTIVYFAGSMFWIRPTALRKIKNANYTYKDFSDNLAGLNGELEHAFERIFGTVTESMHYTVDGI